MAVGAELILERGRSYTVAEPLYVVHKGGKGIIIPEGVGLFCEEAGEGIVSLKVEATTDHGDLARAFANQNFEMRFAIGSNRAQECLR